MRPTEQLKEEHQSIKAMLQVMDRVCRKLEAGERVDPQHLEQMVRFIRLFADKCHHAKEEGLLFPAMEEAGIPREGGPIGVMLVEHDKGREYVRGMSEGIVRYKAGDTKAVAEIARNARGYIALLLPHINKEDTILYLMADMHLSPEQEDELNEAFGEVEAELGPGQHDELRHIVEELQGVYADQA